MNTDSAFHPAFLESGLPTPSTDELFRFMVESVKDYAIFALSLDGRVISWNPGAASIFGYSDEEIIGKSGAVLFLPEDRERGEPERELRLAVEEGRAEDERWHIRADGSLFWASGVVVPLGDEQGVPQGFIKVARDITERRRMEKQLRRSRDELEKRVTERTEQLNATNRALNEEVKVRAAAEKQVRDLLANTLEVQEMERRRISRDLHDHLGQQVTALRLHLNAIEQYGEQNEELRERLRQIDALTKRLDSELDFLVWELRPGMIHESGLSAALINFIAEWSRHFGVKADYHVKDVHLTLDAETCVYRIAQEALNNVAKYAGASQVSVILNEVEGGVRLIVEDDGKGFDPNGIPQGGGLGLIGMRERAALAGGDLRIESTPGMGTTIYALLPVVFHEASQPGGASLETA